MSGYLNHQYRKTRVSTFRGRKIVSRDKWCEKLRRSKEGLLNYLPDQGVSFCEYRVADLEGCVQWLCDYHDLMIMRNDRLFADWIGKGMGAQLWEGIHLFVEMKGDRGKVRAEEKRRGEARLCVVCQSPEVVERIFNYAEGKETAPPTHFCKEHSPLPENLWTTVTDMIEQDRRNSERLCAKCGSPKVVMRTDWGIAPVEYYCAEEPIPKSILSSSPEYIAKWRRGEYDGYRFTEEAFQ